MQTTVDPVFVDSAASVDGGAPVSAVSWPAIAAGTVVAAAASLLLVTLAAGAGLGALSPWPNAGASASSFTVLTAIGFIVIQWLSAGVGGYVTGRLRTKWASLHTHEVFFRDTAHGLITWATATLLVSAAAALIAASAVGTAARGIAAGAAATTTTASSANRPSAAPSVDPYDVDILMRPASPDTPSVANEGDLADMRAQTTRILAAGLVKGDVPAGDQSYLKQMVIAQAHVAPAEAQTRIDAIVTKIKADHEQALQDADAVRNKTEAASIFTSLAMLLGAFIACIAAALGGHRRDVHA